MSDSPSPQGNPPASHEVTEPSEAWHRLHPLSPLLRGGIVMLAIAGIVIANLRDRFIAVFFGEEDNPDTSFDIDDVFVAIVENNVVIYALGVVLAMVLIILFFFWLSWRNHTYRVTEDAVENRSGIVFRQHRRAPIDRIQGVNLQRPMIARLFGLCKLQVTTAGMDGKVELAYLNYALAQRVRQVILSTVTEAQRRRQIGLASGGVDSEIGADGSVVAPVGKTSSTMSSLAGPQQLAAQQLAAQQQAAQQQGTPGAGAPQGSLTGMLSARIEELIDPDLDPLLASQDSLIRIPVGRLLGSVFLNWGMIITVLLAIVCIVGGFVWHPALIITLLPLAIMTISITFRSITRGLKFHLSNSAQGVRVSSGLLSTVTDTIPPEKIHAIEATQPLLWRPLNWWSVRVTTAGFGVTSSGQGTSGNVMLPVGTAADVVAVFGLLLPGHGLSPQQVLDGLTGTAPGYLTSPARARWVLAWGRKRNGIRVGALTAQTPTLQLRRGFLLRHFTMVPLARIQSTQLHRGFPGRFLGLASVQAHTVLGPVRTWCSGLRLDEATLLYGVLARASVQAASVTPRSSALTSPAGGLAPRSSPLATPEPESRTPKDQT